MKKCCTRCGREKSLERFARRAAMVDGHRSQCKACDRAEAKMRREVDREAYLAQRKAYYWANIERERQRAVKNYHKHEYKADLQKIREWEERNPKRVRELKRRGERKRRARKFNAFVEHVELAVLLERDEGLCGICGKPVDPNDVHIDHAIPLARGGEHSYANTQLAHPHCNQKKGARI